MQLKEINNWKLIKCNSLAYLCVCVYIYIYIYVCVCVCVCVCLKNFQEDGPSRPKCVRIRVNKQHS